MQKIHLRNQIVEASREKINSVKMEGTGEKNVMQRAFPLFEIQSFKDKHGKCDMKI